MFTTYVIFLYISHERLIESMGIESTDMRTDCMIAICVVLEESQTIVDKLHFNACIFKVILAAIFLCLAFKARQ
jgi:hypothetical protein